MESKRAVIYARYSSSRQREESIERQIEICNDYAVAHNMLVIGSYVDRKKTGKTDTRPDFQRMIYESSKHLFDVVLVWRYDRFARNLDDHGAYERLLHKNSVDLISATEEIPEGSHSAIIKAVILGGNESYSVELAAKVSDGMHRAAMQGQTSGGPRVFGYRVVDKHYVLDEGEAQVIRQIFTWYDQGKSMTEIVNQLNAQGAVNAAGKPFIISVMRRILTNQMYIGIRLYKGEDIGIRVPAIIDKELFDRVQIQVGKNKCAPARNKPLNDQYLLTTKLFCAQCGSTMSGISGISKNGSKYQYYSCTNRSNKKGCTKHYIGKEVLETAVVDTVKKVLLANNIHELAKAVVKCCNDAQDNGNLLKLESELREVNKGILSPRFGYTLCHNNHPAVSAGIIAGGQRNQLVPISSRHAGFVQCGVLAGVHIGGKLLRCFGIGTLIIGKQILRFAPKYRHHGIFCLCRQGIKLDNSVLLPKGFALVLQQVREHGAVLHVVSVHKDVVGWRLQVAVCLHIRAAVRGVSFFKVVL